LKSKAIEGDFIMKLLGTPSFQRSLLAAVAALGLVAACGDVDSFKFRSSGWGDTEPLVDWNGTLVQLVRVTVPCAAQDSEGLIVPVSTHMEFPGERVATLKASCSVGVEAEVSIDIEGRSIIYDFSSVTAAGVFTAAKFNGYVFTDIASSAPEIVGATIDRGVSTLQLDEDALQAEGRVVRANFEGVSFEETDFLKIDLVFAEQD